ncbi:MAG TPA: recombination-associated protein RdgC [Steroidobacteraceae bacterium]|nr:recombination-associated protein RdgC [Steroidobacteraceae bacterium]
MWFRNLTLFRFPAGAIGASDLEEALGRRPLVPCGAFDLASRGWVPPAHDERLLFTAHGQHLIALGVNQKLLPASIVNQVARERADELSAEQGYPVGRRQMRELKQRVGEELRARALTRRRVTRAWIDLANGWLGVDSASAAKSEEIVEVLRETLGSFAATRLDTERSGAAAMSAWLMLGDAPGRFTIADELELKALDQSKATIRYSRHPLEGKEIRAHLSSGKHATRLGLSWNDRVAFVLGDKLELKRIEFLAVRREEAAGTEVDAAEQFELDFVLMTGEFGQLVTDLVSALGGERAGEGEERVGVAA